MNRLSRLLVLSAVALAGCNLTYDREGLEFTPPASPEVCADQGLAYCALGTREYCADWASDPLNCGGCGTVCGMGVDCYSEVCGPTGTGYCGMKAGEAVCGTYEYPVCVDTLTDANNCGSCGNDCGSMACIGGFCDVTCGGTTPDKCSSATGPYCTDLDTDEYNCGGCGVPCAGTCTLGVCDGGTTTLTVAPLFPLNGAGWNAWVDGEGTAAFDSPCNPSAGLPCTHGGERRQVAVTGKTTCDNLTATDALGAFDWVCDPSTNPVRFLSTGLKPGKRLADLLLVSGTPGWLANSVTVWEGTVVHGATLASAWWSNPVGPVPADGQLKDADGVYVADGSVSPPFVLSASRVALAVPDTGTALGVAIPGSHAVSATGKDFLWVEGDYDATSANHGVYAQGVRYSVFRGLSVTRPHVAGGNTGLYLYLSSRNRVEGFASVGSTYGVNLNASTTSDNRLEDLTLSDCDTACVIIQNAPRNVVRRVTARLGNQSGIWVTGAGATDNVVEGASLTGFYSGLLVFNGASSNRFRSVSVAANRMHGVELASAGPGNRFEGIVATHNAGNGLFLGMSGRNAFTDVLASNNRGNGMALGDTSNDNVIAGLTASDNGANGLYVFQGSRNNFLSTLLFVGGNQGLRFTDASGNTVRDIAFSGLVMMGGLVSEGTSSNTFTGLMLVGPGATCDNGGTITAGFFDTTCQPAAPSDHTVVASPTSLEGSFVGAVLGDSLNASPHDAAGYLRVSDLDATSMDWTHFENPHRAWTMSLAIGALGCAGDANARDEASCTLIWNGDAQLFDASLHATDTVVRWSLPYPDPGSWSDHGWSDGTWATYLPHAVELLGDLEGDEDGLCEQSEACLWTRNIGAYQGHGPLLAPTWFDPTTHLYEPESNGR